MGEFRSISVPTKEYDEYEELRRDFAKAHNIPVSKVSMAMILNVGMTFYKQRRKLAVK